MILTAHCESGQLRGPEARKGKVFRVDGAGILPNAVNLFCLESGEGVKMHIPSGPGNSRQTRTKERRAPLVHTTASMVQDGKALKLADR